MGKTVSKLYISVKEKLQLARLKILATKSNVKNYFSTKVANTKARYLYTKELIKVQCSNIKSFIKDEARNAKNVAKDFANMQKENAYLLITSIAKTCHDNVLLIQSSFSNIKSAATNWILCKKLAVKNFYVHQRDNIQLEVRNRVTEFQQLVISFLLFLQTVSIAMAEKCQTQVAKQKDLCCQQFNGAKIAFKLKFDKVRSIKLDKIEKLQYIILSVFSLCLLFFSFSLFLDVYNNEIDNAFNKIDLVSRAVGDMVTTLLIALWSCVIYCFSILLTFTSYLYYFVCFLLFHGYAGTHIAICLHLKVTKIIVIQLMTWIYISTNIFTVSTFIAIKYTLFIVFVASQFVWYGSCIVYIYFSYFLLIMWSYIVDQIIFISHASWQGTVIGISFTSRMLSLFLSVVATAIQITTNSTLIALEVNMRLIAHAFNALVSYCLKGILYTLEHGTVALSEGLVMLQDGFIYCMLNAGDFSYIAAVYVQKFSVIAAEYLVEGLQQFGIFLVAAFYASMDLLQITAAATVNALILSYDAFCWATYLASKWTLTGLVTSTHWLIVSTLTAVIWIINATYIAAVWLYSTLIFTVTNTKEAGIAFLQWLITTCQTIVYWAAVTSQFLWENLCFALHETLAAILFMWEKFSSGMSLCWSHLTFTMEFVVEKLLNFVLISYDFVYNFTEYSSKIASNKISTGIEVTSKSVRYVTVSLYEIIAVMAKALYFSTVTAVTVSIRVFYYLSCLFMSSVAEFTQFLLHLVSNIIFRIAFGLHTVLNKWLLSGTAYVLQQVVIFLALLAQVIGKFLLDVTLYVSNFFISLFLLIYRIVSIFTTFFYQIATTISTVIRALMKALVHVVTLIFGVIMFVINQILGVYLYLLNIYNTYQEVIFLISIGSVFTYCFGLLQDYYKRDGSDESTETQLLLEKEEPPSYYNLNVTMPAYDDDSGSDAEFQLDSLSSQEVPDID